MTRPGLRCALLLAGLVATACGRARLETGEVARCTHVQATRQVRGVAICEDAWSCGRPPDGPRDRVSLTRLAPCGNLLGSLVVYLPDRHQHGDVTGSDAREDVRLYLAQAGLRVWSLGYRTHTRTFTGSDETPPAVDWDFDTFADDVDWAMGFARGTEASRGIWLLGVGDGATFAYDMARRGQPLLAGIVALDGAATATPPGSSAAMLQAGPPGVDWRAWRALLGLVQVSPLAASPVPGYATARDALETLLWNDPVYGGAGGLSAAREGASDPRLLARYLEAADRWWPRDVLQTSMPGKPDRTVPVLAIASGRRPAEWLATVRASAERFGGDGAVVRSLPNLGHLDLLRGRLSPRQVFEPVRAFIVSHQR